MKKTICFFEVLHSDGQRMYYVHNGVEFTVDSSQLEEHTISVDGGKQFDSTGRQCANGGVWPLCLNID